MVLRSLARLFDTHLINQMDDFLSATAGFRTGIPMSMPCDIKARPALAPLERMAAFCTSANGQADMELDVVLRGDKVVEGVAHRVQFGGVRFRPGLVLGGRIAHRSGILRKVAQSRTPRAVAVARLIMKQRGSGLRIRLPRGDSMRIAEVSLSARDGPGHLQSIVSDDFAAVEATLKRLAAKSSPASASIARQLQACAPRMWVRLQARTQPVSKHVATPMPPPHIVAHRGDSPGQWPHALTYRRLSNYFGSLLAAPGSQTPGPAANVARSCTRVVAALTSAR
jgi:hypothetical protein